ncbi:Avirulence (Avh) protein [Phytophthora megakarya]|uniref:Avirulence (Avh) protein n=1 Tax=Phytophthora megakarya TaxID=4795 RepID=A0A225VNP8_9STRA|nr:Avirulence (Avh) protein [Phytophthora megakarya]
MSSKITPEKLEKWLEKGKSADVAFKRFHLDKPGNFLFDKPHFAVWVGYADKLSTKFPEMSAISTLTKHYGDDFLYQIIQRAKTRRPDMENLVLKLETEQMQRWLGARKDPDDLFRLFHLNMEGRTVFEKPDFITWTKYVDDLNIKHPEEPIWMYSTLTKYFNDDVLFQMTNVAKDSKKTNVIATKVEDDWIVAVLEKHKKPYQVLQNLGLGKTTDNLLKKIMLDDSLAITWVNYMELFNKRYPKEKTTMLETFTKAFGDDGVTKMLYIAKSDSLTKDLAAQMKSTQLKMWLDSGKTTDDVFKLLKLDEVVIVYHFRDEILFETWVSYINAFIKANPDKKDALFSSLQSRFTDRPFNKILNEAKRFPSMEITASKIQTDKIATYLANNKSPKYVFQLIGLRNEGSDLLGSPLFNAWMKYVKEFNKRNPNNQESWFDGLRYEHEYGAVRTIDKAMKNPNTIEIAKKLEKEWLNVWLDSNTLPKTVFSLLDLKKPSEHVLADSKFKRWTTYLNAFNERYPDKHTTMIDGLLSYFNDGHLVRMFKTAKEDPHTEKLAISLENALLDKWMAEGLKPEKLEQILSRMDSAEMIKRYAMKLAARSTS